MAYIAQVYNASNSVIYSFPYVTAQNLSPTNAYAHWDDALCYFFYCDYFTKKVLCLVFNPVTNEGCFYSNTPNTFLASGYNQNGSFVRPLGNRLFMCNNGNGTTIYFQIPNYFVNNGYIQIPAQSFVAVSPCGSGAIGNTYYDAISKTLAVIFNQNFGLDYDSWVSIYASSGNSLVKVAGGYLGNFANSSNSFVNSSFDFPIQNATPGNGAGCYAYQSNGLTQFVHVRKFPNPYYFGGGTSRIKYGGLQCGVPNNGMSYSYFTGIFQQLFNAIPSANYYHSCATLLKDCVAFGSDSNIIIIGNAQYGVQINVPGNHGNLNQGACYIGNGNFILLSQIGINLGFQITSVNAPGFIDPVLPPDVSPLSFSLLNWHRPVSTRGLFKT